MGKIYMIGAMKGGVGKSVSVFNLAYSLKKRGKKVLAVDFDPQSNLTTCFGAEDVDGAIGDLMMNVIKEEKLPEREEYIWERNGVDFIPASIGLSAVEAKLRLEMGTEKMLSAILEPLREDYDFILIDTCPSLGALNMNAMAADEVIVTVNPQLLAMMGLQDFLKTVKKIKSRINERLDVAGILLTMCDARTILCKTIMDQVAETFQGQIQIFKSKIPNTVKVGESVYYSEPLIEYAPESNACKEYEMLSGHNRQNAAKLAGMKEIPVIVKEDLSDDLAYVYVIETNLMQRSFTDLLPSEKAAVMQEQYDKVCGTMKREEIIKELELLSGKTPASGDHNGHQVKSRDIVASEYGFYSRSAARFLHINHLTEPFKVMIDENRLALLAAVDVSYLSEEEQQAVWELVDRQGLQLKPKAAAALRKHGGDLTEETIIEILDAISIKKRSGNEGMNLKLPNSICKKYFAGMETAQMASIVEKTLEAWFSREGLPMFSHEELQSLEPKYFNIIAVDEYDVTIMSRCTGHYWYLHNLEYPE